jgi:hypothetical protein
MSQRLAQRFAGISLAVATLAAGARGSVVFATSNEIGDGINPFTPSYAPLTNDLINGASPVSSVGNFALELSDGIPALTNGVYPAVATGVSGAHLGLATAGDGSGAGTQVTYLFTLSDVARVDVYGGWNDNGRDEQDFTIQFSTDGGGSFGAAISPGEFNPTVGAGLQSATRITISDNAGPLATGVNAIRFNFTNTVENGYTGYAEFDVVAVPEPGALALLGLAAIGLATRRRRR